RRIDRGRRDETNFRAADLYRRRPSVCRPGNGKAEVLFVDRGCVREIRGRDFERDEAFNHRCGLYRASEKLSCCKEKRGRIAPAPRLISSHPSAQPFGFNKKLPVAVAPSFTSTF